jgi:hypothetical protein
MRHESQPASRLEETFRPGGSHARGRSPASYFFLQLEVHEVKFVLNVF